MQLEAQSGNDLEDCGELRIGCRGQRLVEALTSETGFSRIARKRFGLTNVAVLSWLVAPVERRRIRS